MKKIFVFGSLAMLAACNSNESATTDSMQASDSASQTMRAINSPYSITYSSDFEMGDTKNAESLLTIWKDWDNGDLTAHKEMFADSLELHFADGSIMHGQRDSVLAAGQSYRQSLGNAVSTVNAIIPVKSKDKDENWALIWGKEIDTDKNGKVDSFYLQETWRFNKDGKANLVFQYKQQPPPPIK